MPDLQAATYFLATNDTLDSSLTAAIEFAHEIGGEFIVLQVHEDNAPAISLYRLFGFKRVLATTTLYMPQVKAAPHTAFPKELSIRDHNLDTHDCHAAYHLAKATIPAHVQEDKPVRQHHYMIGSELMVDNFWRWLFRLGKVKYWVMEQKDETFVATLKVTPGVWGDVHRISLMVHPKWHGKLEHPLIGLALTHLLACPKRSILFEHPAEHVAGITAFKKIGFDSDKLTWSGLQAKLIRVTVEGGDIRIRDDGGAPTSTVGDLRVAGDEFFVGGINAIKQFRAIKSGSENGNLKYTVYF